MRALLSVSDKTGIEVLARVLVAKKYEILSTGGTAEFLRKAGISVIDVSQYTGAPEMMNGRVKTLHPKIFGGILARKGKDDAALKEHSIGEIDCVVVNLYPFEKTIEGFSRQHLTEENVESQLAPRTAGRRGEREAGLVGPASSEAELKEIIEQIDIGGPSLIRAAAKNFDRVAVVTDPADYAKVAEEITAFGAPTPETRKWLAWKAFERTAAYDRVIANWFREKTGQPELLELHYEKVRTLRYGENPHQRAAFFRNPENTHANVTNARVLHGKELSFNNIVDANSALELVKEFEKPTVVFMKHNNPCGVASAATIEEAFDLSFQVDTKSAFGSVVALNKPVTQVIAQYIKDHKIFIEVIIAPSFEEAALALLKEKPNLRLLETGPLELDTEKRDIKKVAGGILVQTANTYTVEEKDLKVVTKRAPDALQIRAMLFANTVCKHVMSNAVVFAKSENGHDVTVAIGAGQMSRVDSVWIAAKKGGERVRGSVMASDAFFPFPDGVEEAAKAGAIAIISPGGSVKDAEVIAAADRLGIAMVFTGVRLFRH